VRAVATNTVRQLRAPAGFLVPAEAALGHAIEVVSGREEARLVYLGVAHAQPPKDGQLRLVIDIGGGSTECIIGRGMRAAGARKPAGRLHRQHAPVLPQRHACRRRSGTRR
jgi:exopolyphosphatase/guanosine-5'-triphosphate,3'-diphosphate pyrophosphatase